MEKKMYKAKPHAGKCEVFAAAQGADAAKRRKCDCIAAPV